MTPTCLQVHEVTLLARYLHILVDLGACMWSYLQDVAAVGTSIAAVAVAIGVLMHLAKDRCVMATILTTESTHMRTTPSHSLTYGRCLQ